MQEKGLSKIVIQVIFILTLITMFFVDKVWGYIHPPLQDFWYWIAMIFAVGIDPIYLYKIYKWK
jgi:hypothetical protein